MKRRLLPVAGLLVVVWTVSVLGLGAATLAGGVGIDVDLTVPVILLASALAVVLIGYYTLSRGRSRRR